MKYIIFFLWISTVNASVFPPNNEIVPISKTTQERFYRDLYETEINKFKAFLSLSNLEIRIQWENNSVNAFASKEDETMIITVLGGLLRHKQMSLAILQTVLCHELGHHLGGSPYKRGKWSTVEGKSDYYALNDCLNNFLLNENNQDFISKQKNVKITYPFCNTTDYLCQRLILSSKQTAEFSHKLTQTRRGSRFSYPKLEKRDPTIVSSTLEEHPTPQCRLDTFISGTLNNDYPRCWFSP